MIIITATLENVILVIRINVIKLKCSFVLFTTPRTERIGIVAGLSGAYRAWVTAMAHRAMQYSFTRMSSWGGKNVNMA